MQQKNLLTITSLSSKIIYVILSRIQKINPTPPITGKQLNINKLKLKDIATILPGYPFRGSIKESDSGTFVVQSFNINKSGYVLTKNLKKTELTGRRVPDFLKQGDLILTSKGTSFISSIVKVLPSNTVCSPFFFTIRIRDEYTGSVIPNFIHWQLNQCKAQHYFNTYSEGSHQKSIRREVLEQCSISLISLSEQRKFVALVEGAKNEQRLYQQLTENRNKQIQIVANSFL